MVFAGIIQGGSFSDDRGELRFVNDFDMTQVKRFYQITHPDTSIIRAWQGHKSEQKWMYVLTGSFFLAIVKPDNWETPSKELPVQEFTLKAEKPSVLYIPGGYANGFKALEPDSTMLIYSDCTVAESAADNFRFNKNLWLNWEGA